MKALLALSLLGAIGCGSVGSTGNDNDPKITAVMPDHGPQAGGVMVTVTGSGLKNGDPIVIVGGHQATMASAASDSMLTFMLPAGSEGETVDVTVSNGNGFGVLAASFRYNLGPVALAISPAVGRSLGGTAVTITGRGFMKDEAGVPTVTIGGGAATNVQIVSDTMLTATTGPAQAGTPGFTPLDVQLTNANGVSTLGSAFALTKQGLFSFDRNQQRTVFIDTSDGSMVPLRQTASTVIACAVSASANTIYAAAFDLNHTSKTLVQLEPITGQTTPIGKLQDAGNALKGISSLAFVGNTLYGISSGGPTRHENAFYSINTSTGVVTRVGASVFPLSRSAGIVAKDGTSLWVADISSQPLDSVAVATGTYTSGVTPMTGGMGQVVHGIARAGATLYLLEHGFPSTIYTVNETTGVLTPFAGGNYYLTGLCQTPTSF